MGIQKPFWERKTLAEMTPEEWESLCDGCGKCCLYKFEDIDTKELFFTHIACKFLDLEHVRCRVYEQRARHMPSCMVLTPDNIANFYWLPETCAYRRLAEGKKLRAGTLSSPDEKTAFNKAEIPSSNLPSPKPKSIWSGWRSMQSSEDPTGNSSQNHHLNITPHLKRNHL